jgi:hypothetical protein
MDQMGVDISFLIEIKVTGGICTTFSSGYEVFASTAISVWQGGIALLWRGNNLYEVEEMQNWEPNVISLHLMMGDISFYIIGCYILLSNLETLAHINKAWHVCPMGAHPILVGDLNINLCAPRMERKETIAKQVDAMDLVDLFRHFYQCWGHGVVNVVVEEGG